jgi:hypothetical protein
MSPQQGQPSQGDLTGRQKMANTKAATVKQHQDTVEEAQAAAAEAEAKQHGVFDGKTQDRVDQQNAAVLVDDDDDEDYGDDSNLEAGQFGSFYPDERVLTGKEDPATVAPVVAARRTPRPPKNIAHDARVTVRFSCDIDDMTFGMRNGEPNNYTFKEGIAYEVPYELAEHLNGLGVIGQWLRGR